MNDSYVPTPSELEDLTTRARFWRDKYFDLSHAVWRYLVQLDDLETLDRNLKVHDDQVKTFVSKVVHADVPWPTPGDVG